MGAADFGRAWPDGRIASRCPRLDLSGDVAKIIAMSDATEAILTRAERAGGLDAVSALIRRYQKVPRDPSLAPVFARMDPHHDDHVAAFIAEVTDRPKAYTGDGGSHAHMIGRQLGHHLTEDLRKGWLALRLGSAEEISLFSVPEFRAAFVGYRGWERGVRS